MLLLGYTFKHSACRSLAGTQGCVLLQAIAAQAAAILTTASMCTMIQHSTANYGLHYTALQLTFVSQLPEVAFCGWTLHQKPAVRHQAIIAASHCRSAAAPASPTHITSAVSTVQRTVI
eukprot:GHRR01032013.1.p3 GENE.GHRR01032013.1~~GHRR01032013.1.p3  ORF type:complete len:119 (-),score=32.66 GHRR01032013.1:236-592(-)